MNDALETAEVARIVLEISNASIDQKQEGTATILFRDVLGQAFRTGITVTIQMTSPKVQLQLLLHSFPSQSTVHQICRANDALETAEAIMSAWEASSASSDRPLEAMVSTPFQDVLALVSRIGITAMIQMMMIVVEIKGIIDSLREMCRVVFLQTT